ncbi:MAG: hypothetical protein PHN64_06840 [Desulfovibrionaceae bacterium]|nr:hypothetical protein [Desulfovibrionaceae bacterium]
MSLPYSPSRAIFEGNGITTRFPFSFTVWNSTQLQVSLTDTAGNTSTAQGWQVELSATGGTLIYELNNAPLPAGYSLAITRAMPFTQEVDLVSGTRFDAEAIEIAFDKACAERQQLREALARAVKLPETSLDTPENLVQNIYTARNEAQTAASHAAASELAAASSATLAAATVQAGLVSLEGARAEAVTAVDTAQNTALTAITDSQHAAVSTVQAACAPLIATATAQANSATASATAAASAASAASTQATAAAASAASAQAWAEGSTAPNPADPASKSAKSWAEQAGADVTASVAQVTAEGTAQVARVQTLASATPTAGGIPQAGEDGKVAAGWLPSTFLAGGIVLFSGTFGGSDGKRPIPLGASAAEEGWALCDGSNGTPDLRGRFIVGAGEDYAQGTAGGAANAAVSGTTGETTLTVEQMPSHNHTVSAAQAYYTNASASNYRNEATQTTQTTSSTGGSQAHSHSMSGTVSILPPYYALAYIMKLATA